MKYAVAGVAAVFLLGVGHAAPPIEAYGELPEIRSAAISPDGAHVAFLKQQDGKGALFVQRLTDGAISGVRTDKLKTRSISFAGPGHVILRASRTTQMFGYEGRFEYTGAFSYDLEKDAAKQLLRGEDELYPAQAGIGRIVGLHSDDQHVFMPAFTGRGQNPPYDLFKVNLSTGRGRVAVRGRGRTADWIVDRDANVLAREDYDNDTDAYQIHTRRAGRWELIFETKSPLVPFSLVGAKDDKSALVIIMEDSENDHSTVRELGFDGRISAPIFQRDDAGIERIMSNIQREVFGVEYSGFYPEYDFFNDDLTQSIIDAQAHFGDAAVSLMSWSDDFRKLLLYVEGSGRAGDYYLFDRIDYTAMLLAQARPNIASEDVGQVLTISYKARDGLSIPALLTLPPDGSDKNLPLIVLPHGGPESHDAVGFDWMAQYFASRGYMVFQPNFRGSTGFGLDFRDAGRGEWGGKMQDDVTDGVRALISTGRADPDRICIVGASYGGYAALAGGAFTPELYKCVAAIAPVSDVMMMLSDERRDHGRKHWAYDYWKDVIGDPRQEKARLQAISPSNFADAFQAPVLLIHGKDDLVVPIRQSAHMERALRRAGKPVELIRLKGEDHWLSTGETRLETLKALDAFVNKHIGGD